MNGVATQIHNVNWACPCCVQWPVGQWRDSAAGCHREQALPDKTFKNQKYS